MILRILGRPEKKKTAFDYFWRVGTDQGKPIDSSIDHPANLGGTYGLTWLKDVLTNTR